MPFDTTSQDQITQFAAYVCTDRGAVIARAVMERSGGDQNSVHGGGLSGAGRMCDSLARADVILTEIGSISVEMACECVTEICRTGADVIVLGEQTDIATYRALRKAGALEFFEFPVTAEDILAVDRTPVQVAPTAVVEMPHPVSLAPSIAVTGSNGGVGASLLAQNLAYHASAAKGANLRTALLDADLQFGSQAIDLDRDETAGLFEALKAPDRVDATFLSATMDHLNDKLSLYSHQVRIGQDPQPFEAGLAQLMRPLRTEYDALVVDLPRGVLMQQPEISAHLDALILIIPAGFSGVNAATRLIERITAQNPDLCIVPVLSELRKDAGLAIKDVSATIGRPIVATLPHSEAAMTRAHRAARPLVAHQPRGAYAKSVGKLWAHTMAAATAQADTPTRRPFLKRVFG